MRRAYYNEVEKAVYDDHQDDDHQEDDDRRVIERFRRIQKDLAGLLKILEKYDGDDKIKQSRISVHE